MQEDIFWLGFSAFPGIGPARFHKLLDHFGTAKDAWNASETDLSIVIGQIVAKQFLTFRDETSLPTYAQHIANKNISTLLIKDTNYPQFLKEIPNPPFVLYVKGNIDLVSQFTKGSKTIGVVGTRKITHYGEEVTRGLTQELVLQGFTIVSGLAVGVDAVAHQTAIDCHGNTIAVLGCGVDCCSPSANRPLYDKIIGRFGAVVSESAFGAVASKGMFPSRNRIIAGLSRGVLVTEGTQDSGALITAQRALEYGRPVFAVPGPITSIYSKGPLQLIQKGAQVVQSVENILQILGLQKTQNTQSNQKHQKKSDIPEEQHILDLLSGGQYYFDEIVRGLHKDPQTVNSLLSMMEIKGLITSSGGKFSL